MGIQTPHFELIPTQDLFGFSLVARMRAIPDDCKQVNTLGFALALYLTSNIDAKTRDFANECFKNKSNINYHIKNDIYFPMKNLRPKKRGTSLAADTIRINTEIGKMRKMGSPKNRKKLKALLAELNKRVDFISELMRAVIYNETGNNARANRHLRNILEKPLHFNTFLYQNENLRKELDGIYRGLLVKLNAITKNHSLFNAVLMKLLLNGGPELGDYIKSEFNIELDEAIVDEWSKSNTYGRPYASSWILFYLNDSSDHLIFKKLTSSNYFQELSTQNPWGAWVLKNDLSIPKSSQQQIIKMLKFFRDSADFYFKDQFFIILGNPKIQALMEKGNESSEKPVFIEKRNFYKSLLENTIATQYALYQLVKLGDNDLEYLNYYYE